MKRLRIIAAFALASALLLIAGVCSFQSQRSGPFLFVLGEVERENQIARLTEQGNRIVQAVEGFRAEYGRLPRDLAEAGIAVSETETPYGPFRYIFEGEALGFLLNLGDYFHHGFMMYWNHDQREWQIDT